MSRRTSITLLGLALLAAAPTLAEAQIVFDHEWGGFGSGPGQFNFPYDVAEGPSGEIVVADWRNNRIQKFSADGTFLLAFGTTGTGPGQFRRPNAVAVDPLGNIVVHDEINHRVQRFDANGNFLATWVQDGPGGSRPFLTTYDIAVDSDGNVYVPGADTLFKYDPNGTPLGFWPGETGALTIDEANTIYSYGMTLERLTPAFVSLGSLVLSVPGDPGALFGTINVRHDRLFTVTQDPVNHPPRVFDPQGNYIATFGVAGSGPGQLTNAISGIPTADGGFLICDIVRCMLLKYRVEPVATEPTSWGRLKAMRR